MSHKTNEAPATHSSLKDKIANLLPGHHHHSSGSSTSDMAPSGTYGQQQQQPLSQQQPLGQQQYGQQQRMPGYMGNQQDYSSSSSTTESGMYNQGQSGYGQSQSGYNQGQSGYGQSQSGTAQQGYASELRPAVEVNIPTRIREEIAETNVQRPAIQKEIRPAVDIERPVIMREVRPAVEIERQGVVREVIPGDTSVREATQMMPLEAKTISKQCSVVETIPGVERTSQAVSRESLHPIETVGPNGEKQIIQSAAIERPIVYQEIRPPVEIERPAVVQTTAEPTTHGRKIVYTETRPAVEVERPVIIRQVLPEQVVDKTVNVREKISGLEQTRTGVINDVLSGAVREDTGVARAVQPGVEKELNVPAGSTEIARSDLMPATETILGEHKIGRSFCADKDSSFQPQGTTAMGTTGMGATGLRRSDSGSSSSSSSSSSPSSNLGKKLKSTGLGTGAALGNTGAMSNPVGNLLIHLIRGDMLKDTKLIGARPQSPFALFSLGNDKLQLQQGEAIKEGGVSPFFDQKFQFTLDGSQDFLHMVFKHDGLIANRSIGYKSVPIRQLLESSGPTWVTLDNDDVDGDKNYGRVQIQAFFKGNFNNQAMDTMKQSSMLNAGF